MNLLNNSLHHMHNNFLMKCSSHNLKCKTNNSYSVLLNKIILLLKPIKIITIIAQCIRINTFNVIAYKNIILFTLIATIWGIADQTIFNALFTKFII